MVEIGSLPVVQAPGRDRSSSARPAAAAGLLGGRLPGLFQLAGRFLDRDGLAGLVEGDAQLVDDPRLGQHTVERGGLLGVEGRTERLQLAAELARGPRRSADGPAESWPGPACRAPTADIGPRMLQIVRCRRHRRRDACIAAGIL